MRYYGGKSIIGKKISEFLINELNTIKKNNKGYKFVYIEPFCGACGVLKRMSKHFNVVYANDFSKDLILLLEKVKNKRFINPKINRDKWLQLKYSNVSSAERAFAGFGCSFGGSWFNGYIDDPLNNDSTYSSLISVSSSLKNVEFSNKDYFEFLKSINFDKNTIYMIYLDPPYGGTVCFPWEKEKVFSSEIFWNIIRKLSKLKNVHIYISELHAPKDFKCVFSLLRNNGQQNVCDESNKIIKEKIYKPIND